jgi:hypothetical protein
MKELKYKIIRSLNVYISKEMGEKTILMAPTMRLWKSLDNSVKRIKEADLFYKEGQMSIGINAEEIEDMTKVFEEMHIAEEDIIVLEQQDLDKRTFRFKYEKPLIEGGDSDGEEESTMNMGTEVQTYTTTSEDRLSFIHEDMTKIAKKSSRLGLCGL